MGCGSLKNDLIFQIGGLDFRLDDKTNAEYIKSPDDARKIDTYIKTQLSKYKLDGLLLKIHDEFIERNYPDYKNFVFAALAKHVLLNCRMHGEIGSITEEDFEDLLRMTLEYEIYEPKIHEEFKTNPKNGAASYLLRINGKQLQWDKNIYFMLSRTLYIYEELINDPSAPEFIKGIVGSKFRELFGISLHDFIKICAVLWAGSKSRKGGLRRDYFDNARSRGMAVPNDEIVKTGLRLIICDPLQFKNNKLFKKYGINPLLNYPLVRLWENSESEEPFDDKFIAPIPNLIVYRITIGLYYQLYNIYGNKFSSNFGDLFQLYISKIIDGYSLPDLVISENDLESYFSTSGKKGGLTRRPDWVIFTKNGIILLECKAAHYTQDTFLHGIDAKDTGWLNQITKSLDQFAKFEHQLPQLCKKLGRNHKELKIQRVIVSFEPLWGLKKGPLREFVDGKRARDWVILSSEEMEIIQPYIAKGYDLWSFLSKYKDASYNDLINIVSEMKSETGADDSENMFTYYRTKIFDELIRDADQARLNANNQ